MVSMARGLVGLLLGIAAGCQGSPAPLTDEAVLATLWMQTSAEYHGLALQAFNVARDRLEDALADSQAGSGGLPLAVVVDADETVLDNTPYGAWGVQQGKGFERATWEAWVQAREATAVPGSLKFLQFAAERGVEVFYVTNRRAHRDADTLENLAALGFPFADAEHLRSRTESGDKTDRRAAIAATHDIVLLIGDNLGDFDQAFQVMVYGARGVASAGDARRRVVIERAEEFGRKLILLPNPTYGAWEDALYGGERPADDEKRRLRRLALKAWAPEGAAAGAVVGGSEN